MRSSRPSNSTTVVRRLIADVRLLPHPHRFSVLFPGEPLSALDDGGDEVLEGLSPHRHVLFLNRKVRLSRRNGDFPVGWNKNLDFLY